MNAALLVGLGGVAGALARYAVDVRLTGRRGTVVVNVLGSVALGALAAAGVRGDPMLVLGVGFCGSFTTFSSFAVTVATFLEAHRWHDAIVYGGGTLIVALVGVAIGTVLGRM